ncbi:hypothetical protein HY989_00200 [Candidatus Micrarchaeota archaeon]|nr:hypothetical protein [Candidatus Micrarchaeota archaeon]
MNKMASEPEKLQTRIKSNERYGEFKAIMPANELTPRWKDFVFKVGKIRKEKYRLQRKKAILILLPTKAARQAREKIAFEIENKNLALKKLFEPLQNITEVNFHLDGKINRRINVSLINSPKLASLTVFKNKLILDNNRAPAFRYGASLWNLNKTGKKIKESNSKSNL